MLEWAMGSTLQEMIKEKVPGAAFDDWLEGWMVARAQDGWDFDAPFDALDVLVGAGQRPYQATYQQRGAVLCTATPDGLAALAGEYDLVTVLSFEREVVLAPLDFAQPFAQVQLLLHAARRLKPGGVMFWSYLYAYPADPDQIHTPLEPAAVFQCLTQRGYQPVIGNWDWAGERLEMLHDADSLFVAQSAVLQHAAEHRRIVRVFGAVARPGECSRVRPSNARLFAVDGNLRYRLKRRFEQQYHRFQQQYRSLQQQYCSLQQLHDYHRQQHLVFRDLTQRTQRRLEEVWQEMELYQGRAAELCQSRWRKLGQRLGLAGQASWEHEAPVASEQSP